MGALTKILPQIEQALPKPFFDKTLDDGIEAREGLPSIARLKRLLMFERSSFILLERDRT
jgi:hypothetical protein